MKSNSSQNSFVKKSQKMLASISKTLNKPETGTSDMLDELDNIESKIKQHLKGVISPVKEAKEVTDIHEDSDENLKIQIDNETFSVEASFEVKCEEVARR